MARAASKWDCHQSPKFCIFERTASFHTVESMYYVLSCIFTRFLSCISCISCILISYCISVPPSFFFGYLATSGNWNTLEFPDAVSTSYTPFRWFQFFVLDNTRPNGMREFSGSPCWRATFSQCLAAIWRWGKVELGLNQVIVMPPVKKSCSKKLWETTLTERSCQAKGLQSLYHFASCRFLHLFSMELACALCPLLTQHPVILLHDSLKYECMSINEIKRA